MQAFKTIKTLALIPALLIACAAMAQGTATPAAPTTQAAPAATAAPASDAKTEHKGAKHHKATGDKTAAHKAGHKKADKAEKPAEGASAAK